jgi:hypothetical protein
MNMSNFPSVSSRDLGAGGAFVGLDVEGVVVLVDVEAVGRLAGDALGGLDVVLRAVAGHVGGGDDDLAPKALSMLTFSMLILSGMVKTQRYPLTAAHIATPWPVLPLVFSTMVCAGLDETHAFALVEHVHGHAVLDRARGVHVTRT